ncbi:hypothetical protein T06_534 [Trichinella sp. T6]|nr:hypothetical protein T06_534 [Trichinella sp. T6]
MNEARRITLRTVLIEEASYSMDFRNTDPYDRRMEELTAALYWLISRLDDHLPNRLPDTNCEETGDSCEDSATKPSLTKDIYQRKHQASNEARLEKLDEYCMRPVGNQRTRERPQPLRLLEGSSRNADDPLALATDVVIDAMTIIQGKPIRTGLDGPMKLRGQHRIGLKWDRSGPSHTTGMPLTMNSMYMNAQKKLQINVSKCCF